MLKATIFCLEHSIQRTIREEEVQVVEGMLRAYNERIFDLGRAGSLIPEAEWVLKVNGVTDILQLLDYNPDSDDPSATLVEQAFYMAMGLLTEEEWALCDRLEAHRWTLGAPPKLMRSPEHDRRPDRRTTEWWLDRIAPRNRATFVKLLDSKPLRMRRRNDDEFTDLRIRAVLKPDCSIAVDDGEYHKGSAAEKAKLAKLREDLQ
ncbi:hypothetical protein B0H16DRAFT_1878911 [Mycena metata]|uniref:Uncharacterized protein n=1 Tax=Mycena metata TaxID=1033252 RepID=A0AAD7K4H0_9AGAR|nr:hypothetical protein B0H16DRAFT_1878911 [Mycena metata]